MVIPVEWKDIIFDEAHGLGLDIYLPENKPCKAVFVFFHGGGFEDRNFKKSGTPLAKELVEHGIVCVNPDYRHYPHASFPDFIEDGAAAVAWTVKNIGEYCPCTKIFVGGHSAGGHLAMLLCFDHHFLKAHGVDPVNDIAGYIFASGQPTTHFNVLKEMGMDSRAVIADERSPLYHVREKGAPLLVLCTDHDIKNRKEQTDLLVSTLKAFEYESPVEYRLLEGYGHSNYLYPNEKKPQKPSIGSGIIAEFIQEHI
jgi:acetyl esterase/lipase